MIEAALSQAGGNKSKAAEILKITRRMLYTKLKKYGMM
jgi:DNA-binding NtrC family response regulator